MLINNKQSTLKKLIDNILHSEWVHLAIFLQVDMKFFWLGTVEMSMDVD